MADITGMMTIKITDIQTDKTYVCAYVEAAKDSTDRSAYLECVRSGKTVLLGTVVARRLDEEDVLSNLVDAKDELDRCARVEAARADAVVCAEADHQTSIRSLERATAAHDFLRDLHLAMLSAQRVASQIARD